MRTGVNTRYWNNLVGQAIREIRKDIGITQTELGERIGVVPAYISNIESGGAGVSFDMLWRITRALGCYPSDVLMIAEIRATESPPSP